LAFVKQESEAAA